MLRSACCILLEQIATANGLNGTDDDGHCLPFDLDALMVHPMRSFVWASHTYSRIQSLLIVPGRGRFSVQLIRSTVDYAAVASSKDQRR